jgi:hypothetical protein
MNTISVSVRNVPMPDFRTIATNKLVAAMKRDDREGTASQYTNEAYDHCVRIHGTQAPDIFQEACDKYDRMLATQ